MAAKVGQYIAETCKVQHSFPWAFRSCTSKTFHSVSTIYGSFYSASHSCGSDQEANIHYYDSKVEKHITETCKSSTALHGPLGVAPIELFTQFLQYTALSTQPATHVAVMREAYSHHYSCQSLAVCCRNLQKAAELYMHFTSKVCCANRIFH